jgi:AraC-like DNA-binding protein
MITRFRLSSLIAGRLRERSIAPEAVLRRAGLAPALLRQEKILVTTEQLFAFWTAVAIESGDPRIGLALGSESRIERYDPVQLAAVSASSFRDAIERASRYKQLTCPEEIRLVRRSSDAVAVEFDWSLQRQAEPAVLIDLCFAWILSIGRRGAGESLTPLRVEFRRKRRHAELYRAHFGCPIVFGAARNSLVFRNRDLDLPFVTHNTELLEMLAPQLDAELEQRRANLDASDDVKGVVKRLLAGRRPDLDEVARALGASVRTLQRRLGERGVTFQQVLEQARRELARHYLLQSALDLSQIAYLVGYEDANSFFRAFHRWEGASPGRWRERHQKRRERFVTALPHGRGRTLREPFDRRPPRKGSSGAELTASAEPPPRAWPNALRGPAHARAPR